MALADSQPKSVAGLDRSALIGALAQTSAPNRLENVEQHRLWSTLCHLPLKLRVRVPLPDFRVANLVALREGQVIATCFPSTEDLPVELNNVRLGWGEFEVVEQKVAIRLTRLL